jgi:hypothetical protein
MDKHDYARLGMRHFYYPDNDQELYLQMYMLIMDHHEEARMLDEYH